MIKELLIAKALDDIELVWVPILCEDFLDVMLVHAKIHEMDLGARFADKGAVCDVSMG